MPVSFNVADHPANPVDLTAAQVDGLSPEMILSKACAHQYRSAGEILGSSFDTYEAPSSSGFKRRLSKLNPFTNRKDFPPTTMADSSKVRNVIPTPNGFVHTVLSAYNKHHNLIVRPDDVWLAILTQFNFFVNANAERLRANFVAHEGKQVLKVKRQASRHSMNFAEMSRSMAGQLGEVVVDPGLRAWVLPEFSTTTTLDTTTAAIVMMSTLKSYFEFYFTSIECGIPRVKLDGTKADWEALLKRLEKLKEYGVETIAWYHLLFPVISSFVSAFDAPGDPANVTFWQKVAHYLRGGSGPSYYSGWICAFCVFNEEGKWIGLPLKYDVCASKLLLVPEMLTVFHRRPSRPRPRKTYPRKSSGHATYAIMAPLRCLTEAIHRSMRWTARISPPPTSKSRLSWTTRGIPTLRIHAPWLQVLSGLAPRPARTRTMRRWTPCSR